MATTATIGVNGAFPEGTSVGAYPAASVPLGHSGAPQASALDTDSVADNELTFAGLEHEGRYVAAASVSGTWKYLYFNTDPLSDDPMTESEVQALIDAQEALSEGDVQEMIDSAGEITQAYIDSPPTTNVQTGTSYTPVAADAGHVIVELTNNSEVTVTLPTGFVENAEVEFCALGTAGATFVAGAGASIDSVGALVDLEQNCSATARHRGGGEWLLTGALA